MLDGRLSSAAKFVRQGAVFADIGTDHAHLPIFLLKTGVIDRAVCSDINKGPLDKARENAKESDLLSKIDFVLTDGASALEGYGITDVAICGMGGELIARIIKNAPHLHEKGIRLILQPMSKIAHLRENLAALGFSVLSESYSEADGKFYVCIMAEYTAEAKEISEAEAEFGKLYIDNDNNSCQIKYFEAKKRALMRTVEGKLLGGIDASYEQRLLLAVDERLDRLSK